MSRLKTFFLIPAKRGFTGASMAALNIALGLSKRGVEVHVATTKPPSQHEVFLERLRKEGVKVHVATLNPPHFVYWVYLALMAFKHVARLRPSVVHPHTPRIGVILLPLSLLFRTPSVLTLEGDPLYEASKAKIWGRALAIAAWSICRRLSRVVCPCSSWLAKVVGARHPELKGKLFPVPNPVDYERFIKADPSGIKEKLGVKGLMVFTAARLDEVKGVDVLLSSAAIVASKDLEASFVVAGEGPLKSKLERSLNELGLRGSFMLIGFREDIEKLTAACDIAVLPSRYEPFGMPAAEAGACEKPVVVSDVGGLREIVVHNVTGLRVPVANAEKLAEAILKLLQDPKLRVELGSAAKKRVEALFRPEAVALKMLRIYERLVLGVVYKGVEPSST